MGVIKEKQYNQSEARKFYIWLDKDKADAVIALADGRPISEFIRRIVGEWLEQQNQKKEKTQKSK